MDIAGSQSSSRVGGLASAAPGALNGGLGELLFTHSNCNELNLPTWYFALSSGAVSVMLSLIRGSHHP